VVEGDGGDVKITVEADVLVLNEDNFDIMVLSKKIIFVEFYAPWCGHCKALEPQLSKAAEVLKQRQPPISVGKVDATTNEKLAKRYGVTGFPTLFLFLQGKHTEYDGARTAEAIVDYVIERSDPNFKPPAEAVITLTADNFPDVVSKEDLMLVEFYAPWCGHCKSLAPEYERAARHLKKLPKAIKLAKVDATMEKELAKQFDVTGYPTLLIFRKGKPFKYSGPRDEMGIAAHMKSQQKPASSLVTSLLEIDRKTGELDPTVLAVYDSTNHPLLPVYEDATNMLRTKPYIFLHTESDQVVQDWKEKSPSLYVIQAKFFRSEFEPIRHRLPLSSDTSAQELADFVQNHSLPLVGHRSHRTGWLYENVYPICVVYYDVDFSFDGRVDTQIVRHSVAKVAHKYRHVTFAISHESEYEEEMKLLGLDDAGEDVNAGFFLSARERYVLAPEDEFDAGILEDFVDDVLNGRREPVIKSQPVPTKQTSPIITVVGSSFDELVTKSNKNVMIEFFAPYCGHCKSFEPTYRQLAQIFASKSHEMIFAKIDGTSNDYPTDFNVSGYPTIYYIPVRSKSSPHVYEGDRSLSDLSEFVQKMLDLEQSELVKDEL
jgi:protein disulfide-isomerase A4